VVGVHPTRVQVDSHIHEWSDFQAKENQTMQVASCVFPASLNGKYRDAFAAGQGATACVFIGTTSSGSPVAIKVAKPNTGGHGEWEKECREMQSMRLVACQHGRAAQQLAEAFLPTCLEVGRTGSQSFYVMQAAGTMGISDKAKQIRHNVPLQKNIFAQTVAAVYSLHGIGLTHNDLHGHNIVVDGDSVALIDFGEIKGHHRGLGYKHDANSVWRWAAEIAACPENAAFPRLMKSFFSKTSRDELTERSEHLLTCLKDKWDGDDEFISAFRVVLEDAIKISADQHIAQLFETAFIQNNLPELQSAFPWDGDGKCTSSGLEVKQHTVPKPVKMSGRATVGDRIKDKTSGRCGTVTQDDHSAIPYKLKYDDGTASRFLREVQVAWASECL
jgi:serine/threonine protein kinase